MAVRFILSSRKKRETALRSLCATLTLSGWAATTGRADVIIDWDKIACQTQRADTTRKGPTWSSRNLAIVHASMYDAVNSIDRGHEAYRVLANAPAGASEDAAAVQAAYRALVSLYPGQKTKLDAALATSLAAIPDGASKTDGIALGDSVAQAIVAWRSTDGAENVYPFTPTPGPGIWSSDPLHPGQQPLNVGWGNLMPFAVRNSVEFMQGPPPALNSPEYTASFNEVKDLGAKISPSRTADQTQIGIFWAYDRGGLGPPPILYNQNTIAIATAKGNTMVENARLFALTNIAMADAGVTCWQGKYVYNFWRPITAVRGADTDGNPDTTYDPNWQPLGAPGPNGDNFTPPFPAYASGHATFGAALFQTLTHFYGSDKFNFALSSDELPGVTRNYSRFSQASEENAYSRIYLGVHWSFDATQGVTCGNHISDYICANYLRPTASVTGATVTGKIALDGVNDLTKISSAAPLGTFHIAFRKPATTMEVYGADVSLTAAGGAFGTFAVPGVPNGIYDITIKGAKNLRVAVPGVAVSGAVALPDQTLPASDSDDSNTVDIMDFGNLVNAYGSVESDPDSGYDPTTDFNFDGSVDVLDFGLLVGEYGKNGAL